MGNFVGAKKLVGIKVINFSLLSGHIRPLSGENSVGIPFQ